MTWVAVIVVLSVVPRTSVVSPFLTAVAETAAVPSLYVVDERLLDSDRPGSWASSASKPELVRLLTVPADPASAASPMIEHSTRRRRIRNVRRSRQWRDPARALRSYPLPGPSRRPCLNERFELTSKSLLRENIRPPQDLETIRPARPAAANAAHPRYPGRSHQPAPHLADHDPITNPQRTQNESPRRDDDVVAPQLIDITDRDARHQGRQVYEPTSQRCFVHNGRNARGPGEGSIRDIHWIETPLPPTSCRRAGSPLLSRGASWWRGLDLWPAGEVWIFG